VVIYNNQFIRRAFIAVNFAPFGINIDLSDNKLTQLSYATFQPVVQAMLDSGFYPGEVSLAVNNSKSKK